jgi:hypothetical protein
MGNVTINGSVVGGSGTSCGSVIAASSHQGVTFKMGNVTIGGSIIGGSGNDTGALWSAGNMGKVVVQRDVIGADGSPLNATYTGYIRADGNMTSVLVGGSVIAGTNGGQPGMLFGGFIHCASNMGNVTVNGGLIGNSTAKAFISSRANMGNVTIVGRVDHAQILGGYDFLANRSALLPVNNKVQINIIKVLGDWIASSVLVGVTAGLDQIPGTNDDAVTGGGAGQGKIVSITISGQVFGTGAGGDNFGFVSSSIGSFTAAGIKAALTGGKDSLTVAGTTDVVIKEL